MKRSTLHGAISAALATLCLAGCVSTLQTNYNPIYETKYSLKSSMVVQIRSVTDQRSSKSSQYFVNGAGDTAQFDRPVRDIVDAALRAELRKCGFQVVDRNSSASSPVEAVINAQILDLRAVITEPFFGKPTLDLAVAIAFDWRAPSGAQIVSGTERSVRRSRDLGSSIPSLPFDTAVIKEYGNELINDMLPRVIEKELSRQTIMILESKLAKSDQVVRPVASNDFASRALDLWAGRGVPSATEVDSPNSASIALDLQDAKRWHEMAREMLSAGHTEEALSWLDKAIKANPKAADAYCTKAYALLTMQKAVEGLVCCERALEIDPGYAEAWCQRGVAQLMIGKTDEALRSCEKATDLDSREPLAWYNKGRVLVQLDRYQEAAGCFEEAAKLKPQFAEAWYMNGVSLLRLGRQAEAVEALRQASTLKHEEASKMLNSLKVIEK